VSLLCAVLLKREVLREGERERERERAVVQRTAAWHGLAAKIACEGPP